ncbi:MAG: lipid-binding protein [Mucilaginibacter sp.]
MKKINIIFAAFTIVMIVSLGACKKNNLDPGGTATQALANEWWIKFDNGTGPFGPGYFNLSTYNTAANIPTEMYFDDMNNAKSFWDVKGKVNVSGMTFSGTNIANLDYPSTFTITEGKVMPNAAHAPGSKAVTDSIYFKISFSDDSPVTTYTVAGYARTRFPEDDH